MSFFKGFCSLFDWMWPKTLDESLQELHDDMGWGEYKNPLQQMRKEKSELLLRKMIDNFPKGSFVPYAQYNKSLDLIEVFFKDHDCLTQPLNDNLDLIISQETGEVVGLKVLRVKEILKEKSKSKKNQKTKKKNSKKSKKKNAKNKKTDL